MLYKCAQCQTVFSPDPGTAYDTDYYESYDDFTPGTPAHVARIALFRARAEYLATHTDGGRILDIGCARGDFLEQAATCGFTTYGLELSSDAAQVARRRGHHVTNALAQTLPFASHSFAAIHMNHVLEHVPAPLQSLREIRRLLKPNGLALIEVPNEIGPAAIRLKLQLGRLGTSGTEQLRYAPHVIYFNMATLTKAVEQAGLRVIRRQTRFYGEIIPRLSTIPARLARAYDRARLEGDLIEVLATPT
jgi:2-polyprenyl-3-methyl-5-hydroxy-6-metoxy-1,4-benzoquinol methylase